MPIYDGVNALAELVLGLGTAGGHWK